MFSVLTDFERVERSGGTVAVLGLGVSGKAVLKFLERRGVKAIALDDRPQESPVERSVFGPPHQDSLPDDLGLAIVSPGVGPKSLWLGALRQAGVPLATELELGCALLRRPIIAVTGSNGKSTTVSLIAHLLASLGVPHDLVGNIGAPVIDLATDSPSSGWLVLECSSYQLEQCRAFAPQVAVFLNLSANHLERHGSMEGYFQAKAKISLGQGADQTLITDHDDPWGTRLREISRAEQQTWSLMEARGSSLYLTMTDTELVVKAQGSVLTAPRPRLIGNHNRHNIAASLLAVEAAGYDIEKSLPHVGSFTPLRHRIEPLPTPSHLIINDSKATTPAATLAALSAVVTEFPTRSVTLLIGGDLKAGTWESEAGELRGCSIITFGKGGAELARRLPQAPRGTTKTLSEALALAQDVTPASGIILVSPGCASFDEFTDFEARGDLIRSWAHAHGNVTTNHA